MRDELFKNFGKGGWPVPTGTDVNNTTGAQVSKPAILAWEDLPKFGAVENAGPPSNLPMQVSQATILAENEGRDPMTWAETDNEDV